MVRLDGKVALVTGGARGQGAAAVRRFVNEGARVVAADVLDDEGKAVVEPLGDAAYYRHLDVTDEHDWSSAVAELVEHFGRLDVLVNNAGVVHLSGISDTSLADFQRVTAVNQVGTFLGIRAVTRTMSEQGSGSIVNISSIEGLAGAPFLIAYNASKFAVRGMSKTAALELGSSGVRVNSVHPGMIDTGMVREAAGDVDLDVERIGQRIPLRRVGETDDITGLLTFLASDESAYCTGSEFVADGGATSGHAFVF